jgi:hypothetical protein
MEVYRILHFTGLALVLLSIGGISLAVMITGSREFAARKGLMATHGTGLLVMLIAGFGMLARLGLMHSLPGWAYAKIILWFVLGALPAIVLRKPKAAKAVLALSVLVVMAAAYLAGMKPF